MTVQIVVTALPLARAALLLLALSIGDIRGQKAGPAAAQALSEVNPADWRAGTIHDRPAARPATARGPMLRIFRFTLVALAAGAVLLGCDEATAPSGESPAAGALDEIRAAQAVDLTPEEVAETFALGGDYTDLQRDLLRERLVGHVVEWTLKVYDISYTDGVYEVVSQPFDVRSADAVNLLRASLRVYPQRDRDHEALRGAKTNDAIRVRGRVRSVTLRAVVVVDPAVLAATTQ